MNKKLLYILIIATTVIYGCGNKADSIKAGEHKSSNEINSKAKIAFQNYLRETRLGDIASDKELFKELLQKWNDERKLARITPKVALSNRVARLQELQGEGNSLEVKPGCMDNAKKILSDAMTLEIEGFLALMKKKNSSQEPSLLLEKAEYKMSDFKEKLAYCEKILKITFREKPIEALTYEEIANAASMQRKLENTYKAASQGNADAQLELGEMYLNGNGVPRDVAKGMEWLQKAAAQGDASAQYWLSYEYGSGGNVPQDEKRELEWLEKAAVNGKAYAQFNLGLRYELGYGVPKDIAKAMEWYQKAAAQGNVRASKHLESLNC